MTLSSHLSSLGRHAIEAWNAASSDEQTMDVALWYQGDVPPRRDVRLRFCGGRLVGHSPVPQSDNDRILPVAVIPPLVNAHTHLEFSALTEPMGPSSPFPDWIRSVIRWRLDHPDTAGNGIRSGLAECHRHAVVAIGEITTSDAAMSLLENDPGNIVSFRELIGLLPESIPDQLAMMHRHLERPLGALDPLSVRRGVSPHAPYSVHPDLLGAAVESCRSHSVPLAMHLAETTDELELLDTGTGKFAEFLRQMNLWDPNVLPRGGTILRYLEQIAKLSRALAIHCNYLTDEEIRFLGGHPQITVVYCPRTHHYFGHSPHPWQRIQAAGGTVVLGTDGRASNPDLSIWKEVQFLASRHNNVAATDLIPMVTTVAATALGMNLNGGAHTGFNATVIMLPTTSFSQEDALLLQESRPVAMLVSQANGVTLNLTATADGRSGL